MAFSSRFVLPLVCATLPIFAEAQVPRARPVEEEPPNLNVVPKAQPVDTPAPQQPSADIPRAKPLEGLPSGGIPRTPAPAAPSQPVASAPVQKKSKPKAEPVVPEPPPASTPPPGPELKAGWQTQKEARTFTLSVPAPRGQIVDRHGVPWAQSRTAQYLALNFPYFGENVADAQILKYAAERVSAANRLLHKKWNLPQDRVIQHYKNRRWLPLVFSIQEGLNDEVSPEQQVALKPLLKPGSGLMLQPAYLRVYPKNESGAHMIGYTGKTRPLPVGPIQDGDPVFEETEGREGLEKSFDRELQGKAGLVNVLFNPDGTKVKEEVLRRPIPGNNVVTTLDYNFQKYAENALAKHSTGGAMVILDVHTGDILAMASFPSFDPNLYIPGISREALQKLNADKGKPLFARAFQAEYPPASTFKVMVSLAGLENGSITPHTAFDCANGIVVGDRVFKNWNKEGEGEMNVVGAIKRSCNTWFYQAGLQIGAPAITNMAMRMGFGERTGIPLVERAGFVPTDSWAMQRWGHKMLGGEIANLSIGQGDTLVTPLQAAQAMAAMADGTNMPQLRLVLQVQDLNDKVVSAFPAKVRRQVNLKPIAHDTVLKGMIAVVSGANGTGSAAGLPQCQIAGKTGTAQWKPSEKRNLAWFTGFLPANDPLYAFAVLYEGEPGEEISGGHKAAPIVHEVFENIFKNAPPDEPLVLLTQNKDSKKIPLTGQDEETDGAAPRVRDEENDSPPPQQRQVNQAARDDSRRGIGGFFHRLFGR